MREFRPGRKAGVRYRRWLNSGRPRALVPRKRNARRSFAAALARTLAGSPRGTHQDGWPPAHLTNDIWCVRVFRWACRIVYTRA